jgi:hypothetical protein
MLRFGFSKGTFAVLVSYEVSVWTDGVLTHDNQSYASVFVDEFKEKSSRTSFGLEWMFMRDGGLRLFYSSVKSQWSELNTLATSKDLELEMGQLSLSYVFRF